MPQFTVEENAEANQLADASPAVSSSTVLGSNNNRGKRKTSSKLGSKVIAPKSTQIMLNNLKDQTHDERSVSNERMGLSSDIIKIK